MPNLSYPELAILNLSHLRTPRFPFHPSLVSFQYFRVLLYITYTNLLFCFNLKIASILRSLSISKLHLIETLIFSTSEFLTSSKSLEIVTVSQLIPAVLDSCHQCFDVPFQCDSFSLRCWRQCHRWRHCGQKYRDLPA